MKHREVETEEGERERMGDGASPLVVVRGKRMKKKVMDKGRGEELSKLQLVEANKNHCSWATMGKRERLGEK